MSYKFTQPVLKQSLKLHEIYDEHEKIVIGKFQRFYKNKLERIIDFLVDGFFLHLKIYDENSNIQVLAFQAFTIIKDKWTIHADGQTYTLVDRTKIKTNPRYSFFYHDKEFLIFKDYLDKYIRIKDAQTDTIVSEFEYKSLVPPRKVTIYLKDPILDIYLTTCLYSIVSIKY
ncbi:hypothetical protein ACF5W4_12055 [Bacillota bacterium Lsc_1132]